MMKLNFITTTLLLLVSGATFSDNFNYQSVEECADKMKSYALKAHELAQQHTSDNAYMNFFQMEDFFWNISYSKGTGIFFRTCHADLKTKSCFADIYVTCDLMTQYSNLWKINVVSLLEKAVNHLENNQADEELTPHAIPFMVCSTTSPSEGSIINEDHCEVHFM